MDLDLSMISEDDDFHCYNTAEGKPVHFNIEDERQLLPKGTTPTPKTGIKIDNNTYRTTPNSEMIKKLPVAKQTEKRRCTVLY